MFSKLIVSCAAFLGSFIACWAWFPSSHTSPFSLGSYHPSWAMIIAFVVFCLALNMGKE
jgi:hypothetical protein